MKRLLIVTTGWPRFEGDVFGCFVKDLAEALAGQVEVTVLAPHHPGAPGRSREGRITVHRPRYFPFGEAVAYGAGIPANLRRPWAWLQLPFFLLAMQAWTILLARRADVVHAQWGVSGMWAVVAGRLGGGRRVVTTFRGSDLHGGRVLRRLSGWVAKRSDARIVVSAEQAAALAPLACLHIPNPLDTGRFSPASPEEKLALRARLGLPADGRPLLVIAGLLIPLKRVGFMLEAASACGAPCAVAVLGTGPEEEALRAKAAALGLSAVFAGQVPYDRVHDWFRAADLHLMASEREGRPNVLAQAMACGIPSLATPVGAVPEMVEDGRSGLLAPAEPAAYAASLRRLLGDARERRAMGARAREKVLALGLDPTTVAGRHVREAYFPGGDASGADREAAVARFFDPAGAYLVRGHNLRIRAGLVREFLGPLAGKRLLDVGCGDGRMSIQFLGSGNRVTLADLSPGMLELALARVPEAGRQDVRTWPGDFLARQDGERFDAVICLGVLAHVADSRSLLAALADRLAPGGHLVLQFTDADSLLGRLRLLLARWNRRGYGYGINPVSRAGLMRACAEAGLRPLRERRYSLFLPKTRLLPEWLLYHATRATLWLPGCRSEVVLLLERTVG